jgi:hypothetical protein
MNKTTVAVLAIASAASMVGVANAVPFGANQGSLPPGLENQGAPPELATNQGGLPPGLSQVGNNPLVSLNTSINTPESAVPEGGTTLLLVGVGLLAFTLFRRHWQQRLG